MVTSPIRKDLLIFALVLTLFVFFVGFLLGSSLDRFRVSDATMLVRSSELDVESFLLEQDFFDTFGDPCDLSDTRLRHLSDAIVEVGKTLRTYELNDLTKKAEYDWLRGRYFLLELKYYTQLKYMHDTCDSSARDVLLFFYDIADHPDSLRQGYVLDQLVRQDSSLIVLSVDRSFSNPLVQTLTTFYNVTAAPTLILHYNTTLVGFVSEGELRRLLAQTS